MLTALKDPKKIAHMFSTVWILIFDKRKDWCYLSVLFYSAISVTCYSIIMNVALVIEAAK